jgi:hypothetical protein
MVERARMSVEAQLRELLDKQAITEVLQRYSRTLDWLDDEGQAGCFWPDAHIDYGFFTGSAADFLPVVMQIERASQRRWHFLSTPAIAIHSPDRASVECYGMATGIREQDDGTWSGGLYGGRYLDEFAKQDGEWRIARRKYIMDWKLPLDDQPGNDPNPDFPLPVLRIIASGHPDYRRM